MEGSRSRFSQKKTTTGQATVEYVLLLIFVAGISVAISGVFSRVSRQGIGVLGAQLEIQLCGAGFREACTLWEN